MPSSGPFVASILAAAIALPLLLAHASVPDSVFFNQVAALLLWGLWLGVPPPAHARAVAWPAGCVIAALLLLAALAIGPRALAGRTPAEGLLLVAAAAVLLSGRRQADHDGVWTAWSRGWWLAGLACVAVALVQYFAPALAELSGGWLIAVNTSPGRAVGNMRQPNHLSTALLCAIVMTASLWQAGRLSPAWGLRSVALMVFALVLSASRTGMLSLVVLVAWALLDRSLPRALRRTLAATPLLYAVAWGALALYARWLQAGFYGAERLTQQGGDISSSRWAIWHNTLTIIGQQPWAGVGWGNFNIAWTFTPLPDRPVAFFDHTHNALLQLAVEVGLPVTLAVLALLAAALWGARGALQQPAGRAALALLVVLALHSQLEYPLWYAYFLLPAAWVLGVFLGLGQSPDSHARRGGGVLLRAAGGLMVLGALYAVWDHQRVVQIFAPSPGAGPLAQRIERGQRSWLFGHHADYAAATATPGESPLGVFDRPLHQLVDARFLQAYAEALHAAGHEPEALYAAQRLREFKRPDAQAWFAQCDQPEPAWQCDARPAQGVDWRGMAAAP